MRILAVSDLHIWGPEDPLYLSLLSLIRNHTEKGDTVVLAGDLFDLFVGHKQVFVSRYAGFISTLSEAAQKGVTFHYIEGNHDFLIKRVFQEISGVHIHSHDVSVEAEGKKFYFAHGDTVDSKDYGYRFLRLLFRSPLMKCLVTLVPGKWLDAFGQWSSQKSRKRKPAVPTSLPLGQRENLRKAFRSYAAVRLAEGYDFVVMGHCHDLDEMFFNIGGRPGQYVNIGFPRVHGSFLSWSTGESQIHREKLPEPKQA